MDRDSVVGPGIQRAADAWPHRLPIVALLGPSGLKAVSSNLLLRALLESDKVIWPDFERFLTSLRAGLLELAGTERRAPDVAVVRLCCALARQSIINEYVWDETIEEQLLVEKIVGRVSSESPTASAMALAILLAYVPVDRLSSAIRNRSWPESVKGVLVEASRESGTTKRNASTIRRLTPISNKTSLAVQEQYEQNPYPRWVKLPVSPGSRAFDDWFPEAFPNSSYRPVGGGTDKLDVLVAGCGTGRQAIEFAQTFPGSRVLGVDLSLPSLCYAREKTRAMGLFDVEYAQADILELDRLRSSFDIIVATGVLHHLSDPEKGWSKLISLLRPDGCMQVALYSAFARRNIAIAREWLAKRHYGVSQNDIRLARQELMNAAAQDSALRDVVRFSDFYSMSECRDLLLHRREICFTIPRIGDFITRSGANFIGFKLDHAVLREFAKSFSPQQLVDLSCWHQFEIEHPDTFRAMYTFWIQQRP